MSKFTQKPIVKKAIKIWNYFWGLLGAISLLIGLILGCINLYERFFKPEVINQSIKEYVFGNQNYFVQALVGEGNKVVAYSITTTNKNFNPVVTILENAGYFKPEDSEYNNPVTATTKITLGKDTFADLNKNPENPYLDKPENILATVLIRRFYYQEEYYFGNPGNYQSYFFAINDSGFVETSDFPDSFYDLSNNTNIIDENLKDFRENSIINTFQITSPMAGWKNKELRNYIAGADYDQIRVIPEQSIHQEIPKIKQLENLAKLSTEVDIQYFVSILGQPLLINSESTTYLRENDKTLDERFEEEFNKK